MYKLDNIVWEITYSCNINCLHCGSNATAAKRAQELTTEEALNFIEQLSDLGCRRVVLSGGEPFMRKDWDILVQRILHFGMKCNFISNGTLINDDIIKRLNLLGVNYLGFSLDGSTAEMHDYIRGKAGVFDHLMWVYDTLKANGFKIATVTTVHKGNISHLEGILEILLEHGVDVWQVQTANVRGRMPKEWALDENDYYEIAQFISKSRNKYSDLIKIFEADSVGYYSEELNLANSCWQGCPAGISVIGVESDGSIKGCLSMQDTEDRSYIEGNIREKSLREIWENPDGFAYNRRFKPSDLGGICADCTYGNICRGGCSEKAKSYTGQLHNSPFCLYHTEQMKKLCK